MKKTLLLALSLVAGMAVQAQPDLLTTSPWVGNPLPEESGTYYLYNVETGLWFQNNRKDKDKWTTHAQADVHGFDVIITKLEDGNYQINPRFGNNHSVNGTITGAPGYMDTGGDSNPVTPWEFTPSSLVDNGFEITCDNGNGLICLEWVEDELYAPEPFWGMNFVMGDGVTWQLVTKEERLADLAKATKDAPKDATWLIDDWDFSTANERHSSWVKEISGSGSGIAFNQGWRPNRAAECWSRGTGEMYQVIEGLPNGTYGLTLQGYYRDGSTTGVLEKHTSGTEEIRAWYFANDVQAPFMSICDNGVTEEIPDVYAETSGFFGPGDGGSALPRASNGFYLGYYWNEELKVVVTDGTLRIGVRKDSDVGDDWLVFDNFNLKYYGSGVDLEEIKANLQKNIDEAEAYEGNKLPALTTAIAAGKAALDATEAEPIVTATTNIQSALAATKAMNNALAGAASIKEETEGQWVPPFFPAAVEAANAVLNTEDFVELQKAANELQDAVNNTTAAVERYGFLTATIPFAEKEGVDAAIITSSKQKAESAASINDVNDALNALRIARKVNAAETHPDVFKGSAPAEGDPEMRDNDFYFYNIGTQRFLCGGDDWGAHCAVGFPGQAITLLVYENENGEPTDSFYFDTHLNNGGELEYLGYNGYMDTGARDPWFFRPVEGKEGVYNICRRGEADEEGNVEDIMLGYAPGTYNVVHSDMKGYDNPNNQWKLVSRYDREDLLLADNVSESNPVDASFYISCPNFSQRDDASAWMVEADGGSTGIYGRGNNKPDFAFEGWNTTSFNLSQYVEDLPAGWYRVSLTGYYRDGDHANQILNYAEGKAEDPNYEPAQFAEFYAGDTEEAGAYLPNITEGIGLMPGMGNRGSARRDYGEEVDPEERYGEWQYIGEFPYWCDEAVNWFQMGFYKTEVLVEVQPGNSLMLCVNKEDPDAAAADWVVVDNFRITYFGPEKPAHWKSGDQVGVKDLISNTKGDNKTYNLQGIQLNGKLKSGIYVKNGRKVLVK